MAERRAPEGSGLESLCRTHWDLLGGALAEPLEKPENLESLNNLKNVENLRIARRTRCGISEGGTYGVSQEDFHTRSTQYQKPKSTLPLSLLDWALRGHCENGCGGRHENVNPTLHSRGRPAKLILSKGYSPKAQGKTPRVCWGERPILLPPRHRA